MGKHAKSRMMDIRCPSCGSSKTEVTNSRPAIGSIRRRRQCACGVRFTTKERALTPGKSRLIKLKTRLTRQMLEVGHTLVEIAERLP
jgi:transcriptional regulator NrdR family protein